MGLQKIIDDLRQETNVFRTTLRLEVEDGTFPIAVDNDARVLGRDGKPIPNLFAGGGAAGGLSGRSGGAGYASGNGLLSAIALGRLAGLAAAIEIQA